MGRDPGGFSDPGRGRWRAILESCGMDPSHLSGKQCPCPKCGGKDRFRFDDKDGRGTWYCNVCGAGDGYHLLMYFRKVDFKQAKQMVASEFGGVAPTVKPKVDHTPTLNALWSRATADYEKIGGYLSKRGITAKVDWIRGLMRFHPRCPWTSGAARGYAPAILTRIYQDGKPVTLHRTFLDPEVPQRKMLMPHNGKLNGCYIPFGGAPKVVVGIAEGIETALSCMQMGLASYPVWASTSALQMERFTPPEGVREVTIFGDNDESYTGQAAAYTLAKRLTLRNKLLTTVLIPEETGQDWNDCLNIGVTP